MQTASRYNVALGLSFLFVCLFVCLFVVVVVVVVVVAVAFGSVVEILESERSNEDRSGVRSRGVVLCLLCCSWWFVLYVNKILNCVHSSYSVVVVS